MTKEKIVEAYSDYINEYSERPRSVANFAKNLNIEEVQVYEYFASFCVMESYIMDHFVKNAINLTQKNVEISEKDVAKESLLTFYYSFIEILTANRSLVLFIMPSGKIQYLNSKVLQSAKVSFLDFFNDLNFEMHALSFIPESTIRSKTKETVLWGQFQTILMYWLSDQSSGFEKTDQFIEKNLKLSFDIADSNITESLVDFGKFLFNKS